MYIYIYIYLYIVYLSMFYLSIYLYIYIYKAKFNVCGRYEHKKITYFFHTDIFQNCIFSSVYVCVKDTC